MRTEMPISMLEQTVDIEATRVRMLYESIKEGSPIHYGLLAIVASVCFFGSTPVFLIAILMLVAVSIRLCIQWNIKQFFQTYTKFPPSVWENRMVVGLFSEAFFVSSGLMLLINADQQLLFYIMTTLVVMIAVASLVFLLSSIKSHYARVLALLLPVSVELLINDEPLYWLISALLLVIVIPSLLRLGKKFHESLLDTLRLRFENAELLAIAQKERGRAEKASADKMRFLASASYDLRQPTHALELFSDALAQELTTPVQHELMAQMKESTAAMNGLLYSLLDISRLDAEIVTVSKSVFRIDHLLQKLIQSEQQQAAQHDVEITFDASPCAVVSDVVLLESVLQNLLSNAVKYTLQGRINISCEHIDEKLVQVSIKDTGIGMTDEEQTLVFDEFVQLDNPERDRRKGLGLGLAIVKRTCALLEHRISLQSEKGVGSTFTLEIEAADIGNIAPQTQAETKVGALRATVLVLDDERTILEGMNQMLTRWGCDVLCAITLDEALSLVEHHGQPIDLIIADYRLGEGQLGTDAIAAIKQSLCSPKIPAIIITGDTGAEQLKNIEGAGYHMLHKPVAPIRMRALMQNLLKQAKS